MQKKSLKKMLWIILRVYVGVCLLMYFFQRSMIYHPTTTPDERLKHQIDLPVNGATLKISVAYPNETDALIYFGGNAEDVSYTRLEYRARLRNLACYFVHYRGYGGSSGRPTESDLQDDAQRVYDFVAQKHKRITVVGRSLGTGVAVPLAAKNKVERLVLITPYDSILNVAKSRFPIFPVSLMLKDRFDSTRHAKNISAPTTILMAEHDRVIPRERTEALHQAFQPGVAKIVTLVGVGHNTITFEGAYLSAVKGDS